MTNQQLLATIIDIENKFPAHFDNKKAVDWLAMRNRSQEHFQHYINLRRECRARAIKLP